MTEGDDMVGMSDCGMMTHDRARGLKIKLIREARAYDERQIFMSDRQQSSPTAATDYASGAFSLLSLLSEMAFALQWTLTPDHEEAYASKKYVQKALTRLDKFLENP